MRRSIGIKALSLSLAFVLMGISSINSFAYSDDYSIEVIDESTETVSDLSEDLIESDDVDTDVFEEDTEVIEDDYLSVEGADLELLSDYADTEDTVDTEGDDELVYVSEPIEVPGPGYGSDDSDILLDEYINKLVNEKTGAYEGIDQADSELLSSSDTLNGVVYDFLKGNIVKVAAGELDSTKFTKAGIDLTPFYDGKEGFSKEELGVSDLDSSEAFNRVLEELGFDYSEVIFSLLTTLPYDLYWFDKVSGSQYSTSFTYNISNDLLKVNSISLTIDMYVAPDFSADGTAKTTNIDIEKTGAAKKTVATAEKVVADAITSGYVSDYEKLKYYKTYICDAVSYNKTAASSNTAYGNPWQLIYVFDGDPLTNVVCEGYSKAFKLLCDLSDFASDKIMCQLMTGTLQVNNQSPGAHMWNVVHMDDGLNYLVDVTNCDTEVPGYEIVDERLFLVGYSTCDDTGESWFVIQRPRLDLSGGYILGDAVGYAYDSQTSQYYSSSQKKIAAENYAPNSEIPVVTSYTVSFDANGGTLSGADSSISVENGEKYGSLPTPVREGYVFAGWYTAAEGGSLITADSYVSKTADHTLYAHWSAKELTVTFNPGEGSLAAEQKSKKVRYDAGYGTLPTPVRSGYTFAGWYTAAEGGSLVNADSTVTVTADHTLYAHWEGNELTVTFYPGAGKLEAGSQTKKVKVNGNYGSLPTPVRDGYDFIGWYTAAEGGSLVTADSYVSKTADHTLYAHWTVKELTVTFNPGEGSLAAEQKSKKVRYDAGYGTLPTPVRSGYTFAGWYTAAEGGSLVNADSTVTGMADHTLYAHWEGKELTVTFYPGAGKLEAGSRTKKVKVNGNYGSLPTPVRDGYDFIGWYTAAEGGSLITSDSAVTNTADHAMYARWTAKELTITFNPGAGNLDENSTSKEVNYNSKYGTLPTPVRDGYTFAGWYTELQGGSIVTAESTVTGTTDFTLYAHWTAKELTVTFNAGAGSLDANNKSRKVNYNSKYGTLPVPVRDGYTFSGWYTVAEGGSLITADSAVTNTADHTLYAHWSAKELTVTFNPGEGSLAAEQKSKKVRYDAGYGTLPTPVRSGYTFAGWYTAAEGGSVITADRTVTRTADHTLYAHWAANELTVTFYPGAGKLEAGSQTKKVKVNGNYGSLPTPVRDGYNFIGWYTAAEGGSLITSDSAVTNTADHTLYAHWEGKELTITLNPGEGNLEVGSSTKKVRVNGNYGSLPIPSREGYNFAGWYTAAEDGSLITSDSAVTNTADHTLYAHWTAKELTVTVNPGDGSLDAGSKSKKVNYNAKYGTLPVPVLDGYTFAGWFTAAEGGSVVSADDTVTNSDDYTLYAHWTKNQGEDSPGESGDIGGSGNEGDDENDDFIIPDGLWASGIKDEYKYTGSPITPQIKVYYGSILLRKGAEYTVSYKNNKNAGTATITISGKGNFSGKCTAEFAITPLEIADGDVDIAEGLYNKGKEVKPVVTVIHDGVTLKAGRDYKLEYAPITTVGEREIKVIGTGNYTGEAVGKFIVRAAATPLLKSSVIAGLKKSYTLDEINALEEDSSQLIVTLNKKQLDPEDYTFKFENCSRIGKGTIVILPSGNGHYAGEKRVSVTIVGKKLGSIVLTNATCMYNGEEAAPEVKVYTGSKGTGEQVPENAYELSFNNDPVNAGTYTITAVADTAKGYSGKTSAKLKITPRPITDEGITVTLPETVAYTQGAVRPSPVVTYTNGASTLSLREGIDYTISYANNKQVGAVKAPTFTIAGKGNFSGKRAPQEFTVVKKDISELAVSCADIAANHKKKGAYYCSKPVIYDVNGTALKENKDYRVRYIRLDTEEEIARTDVLPEGTRIRADITACERNYTGSTQATYLINSEVKNIAKAKAAKIQNQNYTGKAIEPDALDLTLDKHLVEGQDYVITSYYNNVNKGTASVRIEGIGSYSGCKILKFKIVAANNNRIWKGKFNR